MLRLVQEIWFGVIFVSVVGGNPILAEWLQIELGNSYSALHETTLPEKLPVVKRTFGSCFSCGSEKLATFHRRAQVCRLKKRWQEVSAMIETEHVDKLWSARQMRSRDDLGQIFKSRCFYKSRSSSFNAKETVFLRIRYLLRWSGSL